MNFIVFKSENMDNIIALCEIVLFQYFYIILTVSFGVI